MMQFGAEESACTCTWDSIAGAPARWIARDCPEHGDLLNETQGYAMSDHGTEITWTCHICSDERPDHLISVVTKPVLVDPPIMGEAGVVQNIRYCNDRPSCADGAINSPPLDLRKDSN